MVSPGFSRSTVSSSVFSSIMQWDKDVSFLLYRWYAANIPSRIPLIALEISGHGVPWLILPILIFVFKSKLSPVAASLMLNFLALTLLDLAVIGILKPVFRRARPAYNSGIGHVTIHLVDQFSFPSGHATRAGFLTSFVWHTQAHHAKGLHPCLATNTFTVAAILWGVAICISRVMLGRHHVLDVMVGFVLGVTYVYAWEPFWIDAQFAESLRDGLRSPMFASAHVARAVSRLQVFL
eukprot:GFKZ01006406.1.p1 GENE.GFKZ01006406.1~~GFKZ01006406.1.p1  ORF type:complete len:237 (+),score=13.27 GFKZ01006406.1:475-1185(+)